MKVGWAAWAGLSLVVATCLPLDERSIDEQSGGSAGAGGKGGGGKAGNGEAGLEAGAGNGGDPGGGGAGGSSASGGSAGKATTGGSAGSGASGGGAQGGSGGAGGTGGSGGTGGDAGTGGSGGSTGGDAGAGGTGGTGGGAGTGGAGGAQGGSGGSGGAGTSGGGTGGATCVPVAGWDVDATFATGVTSATDIAFHADGRAVVTQKSGSITIRRTDGTKNVLSGKFGTVDTATEKGLLGVVADPNPATNAFYFYVSDGTTNADKHRVYRGTLSATDDITIDFVNPVIAAARGNGPGLEGPANHDGGGLIVHDGKLFLSVGDTGSNATPPVNKYGSCLNKGNGKILRVNLDGSIPSDNPLVGVGMVSSCSSTTGAWSMAAPDQRIYAWGLRNPWRFWIDPVTDLLWIGDVGEMTREEISVGTGNQHYGYPFNEGTQMYGDVAGANCSTLTPSRTCTGPVHDYGRSSGTAVIGGLIPEGCGWSNVWNGELRYVFADYAGPLRALQVKPDRTGLAAPGAIDLENPGGGPASIRMGPDESLYLVLNSAGAVIRYTPKSRCGTDCN